MNGSVRPSVCLPFCLSVCLSVTPFWLCSHYQVTTQLNRFRTVTPVWIHIWWCNDAYSLMMLRRGALLSQLSNPSDLPCSRSSVKFQSHTAQKRVEFWARLGVSGLYLEFEFTNGYQIIHKAWSSIDVPYCAALPIFPSVCPSVCLSVSCDHAALPMVFSVRLSVRLSVCHTFFTMFPSSYYHWIFRS